MKGLATLLPLFLAAEVHAAPPTRVHLDPRDPAFSLSVEIDAATPGTLSVLKVALAAPVSGPAYDLILIRRIYKTPPADGIYEYDAFQVPRDGSPPMAIQGDKTTRTAVDGWPATNFSGVAGIRVYGDSGADVVEILAPLFKKVGGEGISSPAAKVPTK